jgi:hypothetical protein
VTWHFDIEPGHVRAPIPCCEVKLMNDEFKSFILDDLARLGKEKGVRGFEFS